MPRLFPDGQVALIQLYADIASPIRHIQEMARVKSSFRKRFNIRYWRWLAARGTIGLIGPLRHRFSFYPRAIEPLAVADEIIENREAEMPTLFTGEEIAFVRDHCWLYDTAPGNWTGGITANVKQLALTINSVELLGHVGRISVPSRDGVVMIAAGRANWNFAKAKRLQSMPALAERCHLLARTENYYHAIFHDLVPVVDYLERLHPKGTPLVLALPPSHSACLSLGCVLLAHTYPDVRIVALPDDSKMQVERALWLSFDAGNAEWTFGDMTPVRRLSEIFKQHYNVGLERGRRIFFSRGGSKIRRLRNEDALWEQAKAYGFERFEARHDNHAEQVRTFSQADVVIGVHGAGLANLMFCNPMTKVIELFPANFTKSTYLWLSKRMGLDYHWILGGAGDYNQEFSVDVKIFRDKIRNIVDRRGL